MSQLAIPEAQSLSEWSDRRLDTAIRRGHNACGRVMANYDHVATLTGVLLREKKARLGPRKFKPWVEEHFDGSVWTAYEYMKKADQHAPIHVLDHTDSPSIEASEDGSDEPVEAQVVEESNNGASAYIDEYLCPTCHGTGRIPREE